MPDLLDPVAPSAPTAPRQRVPDLLDPAPITAAATMGVTSALSPPKTHSPVISAPKTAPAAPVSTSISRASEPVDLLSPAPSPVNNLAPLAAHEAQQAANDQTFFGAEARLGGFGPEVHNLADEAQPPTPKPALDVMHMTQGDFRKAGLLPAEQKPYLPMSKADFENAVYTERGAPGTDIGNAYASHNSFHKTPDGNYLVRQDLHQAIGATAPEPPQQSLGQDLKNVPANIGAGVTRGFGGVVGAVGTAIQRPGQIVREMGRMFPTVDAAQTQTRTGIPDKPLDVQAGQFAQRQGDYLAQGAAQTEQDLPVQGAAGKLLVGAGTLGVDAAMSTLVGPSGFVASFAGRSAGTMYVQSRALGDDENTAAGKALTAGFTAAVTPQLAHILPPQVGQEIAVRAARAYLGTGGMVAAQAMIDELTLKAGTALKVDLSHVFPEAGVQGLIGVAMHGGHSALGAHQDRAANPAPAQRTAEAPLTRPEDQATPALQPGDYGAGLGKVPDLLSPVEKPAQLSQKPVETPVVAGENEPIKSAQLPPNLEGVTPESKFTPPTNEPDLLSPVPPEVQAEFDARGKGGKTPPVTETHPATIGEALRAYDEGAHGIDTIRDLVNQVGAIARDQDDTRTLDAVRQFNGEVADDRGLKGRGDLDEAERRFLAAVRPGNEAGASAGATPDAFNEYFQRRVGELKAQHKRGEISTEELGRAITSIKPEDMKAPAPQSAELGTNVAGGTSEVGKTQGASTGEAEKTPQTRSELEHRTGEQFREGWTDPGNVEEGDYVEWANKSGETISGRIIASESSGIAKVRNENGITRNIDVSTITDRWKGGGGAAGPKAQPRQQPPAPARTAQPQTAQPPSPAQRIPPGGAGLTIEPHGQGLRIVRASPKLTLLGEDWEGKKLAVYNAKAGGWIFHPKNEGAVRAVMEKINGENKAAPSGPVPVIKPGTQTPANETAQPQDKPSRTPVKKNPRKFTRTDLEARILQHYNEVGGYGEGVGRSEEMQQASGGDLLGGSQYTFYRRLPEEVKSFMQGRPEMRRLFRVTNNIQAARGADTMSALGDKYFQRAEEAAQGKNSRTADAVDFARSSQDPEMQLMAAIHDNLPAAKDRGPTEIVKPADQPTGTKFKLHGAEFEIVTDADGHRLLKDGDEYPTVPADYIPEMPADKGSVTSAPARPKFFDPAAEGIKSGEQKGIFGQSTFDAGTGKRQGGLFHEPVQVERPTGDSAAEARIRAKFEEGEKATGEMFGNRTDAFGGRIKEKPATPAPEPKPVTKSAVKEGIFGKDSFIGSDVIPLAKEGAKAVHEAAVQLQKAFAPQTRGAQAGTMQGIAREHGATLAQRSDRALESLKDARRAFEGNKPADNYDFIDKMESGEKQANPRLTDAARRIRDMLDGRRREVQALGKGKLEHFIQDYFPHIWEDPEAAAKTFAQILGKRPLEGSKGFLKKRSIDTFSEGIELGLKPISDNPVDLVLLKIREMDRYILGQRMLAEMKPKGLAKYIPATERLPDGFTELNDKIAQVYGPPTVKVEEHVDKAQYDALTQVMENLGINHERVTTSLGRIPGGGKVLGLARESDKSVQTKFGTGTSVLAHEIGHQLDYKYDLGRKLLVEIGEAEGAGIHSPTRPPGRFIIKPQSEFDALSKLRYTNVEKPPSKKFREYNGSTREQMAQVVEAYMHAPDRMREVAPKVYQAFSEFVHSRPELAPLADARSSLSWVELKNEVAHGGLLKMGRYAAPDAVANVFNNYLSPGLRDKSGLFRAYLGTANVMNQAQLGFSAFHVGFTSMDAMTSKLALGIEQAVEGKPVQALASLAATPVAPFSNIIRGSKLLREWLKPGTEGADIAKLVDGVRAAGGRAKQDNFYRTAMFEKMVGAFKRGNIIGGVLRLPAGALDLVAKPVMEYIVPRQKLGVFADLAQKQLAKLGPDASRDEVRSVLGKAWDSVDNRMGQVVYDNLFWNKAIKDISMASVRSLGWNLGTFRELGGGAIDFAKAGAKALQFKKPEFTHRMAYTLAMPALAGLIGGTLHYLMTGKKPEELKDYFFPKTGETDANGHDVRLSLPSYMKDVYAYAHNPAATLGHKLHPAIATTIEMLQNKDFYGTEIVNEDDPLMKRVMDRVKYVGKQFVPFGVQGYQKLDEEGAPLSKKVLPFIGITQAPGSVSMTKAEQVAQDLMRERMPVGSRTQVEADRTKAKTDIVKQIKAGKPGAMEQARDMLKRGEINVEDLRSMQKRSKQSPLAAHMEHLDIDDALKVWQVADAKERQELRPMMLKKVLGAQRMPNDQKTKARQAISKGEDVKLPG